MSEPVSAGRLKSFVERIERLEEERQAIGGDIREVYSEAKGVGYDVKTVRWLVQERKVDASERDERDALRDTYANALGMAVALVRVEGLSLRDAAKATGVSKSSIHRALAVPAVSQIVEMTAGDLACPIYPAEGAAGIAKPDGQAAPHAPETESTPQRPTQELAGQLSEPTEPAGVEEPTPVNADAAAPREGRHMNGQGSDSGISRHPPARIATSPIGPVLTAAPPDIDIPPFLRREREVAA